MAVDHQHPRRTHPGIQQARCLQSGLDGRLDRGRDVVGESDKPPQRRARHPGAVGGAVRRSLRREVNLLLQLLKAHHQLGSRGFDLLPSPSEGGLLDREVVLTPLGRLGDTSQNRCLGVSDPHQYCGVVENQFPARTRPLQERSLVLLQHVVVPVGQRVLEVVRSGQLRPGGFQPVLRLRARVDGPLVLVQRSAHRLDRLPPAPYCCPQQLPAVGVRLFQRVDQLAVGGVESRTPGNTSALLRRYTDSFHPLFYGLRRIVGRVAVGGGGRGLPLGYRGLLASRSLSFSSAAA